VDIAYEQLTTNSAEYKKVHRLIPQIRGLAAEYNCVDCCEQSEQWTWTHGKDPHDVYSYDPRCHSCHNKYDNIKPVITIKSKIKMSLAKIGNDNADRGSSHWATLITESDVIEIRKLADQGISRSSLQKRYRLSEPALRRIIKRQSWRHI
jgi:hypothetical protein